MYAQRLLAGWLSKDDHVGRQYLALRNVDHEFESRSALLRLPLVVVAAFVFLWSVSHIQAAPLYSIIDLGDLPGGEDLSAATAVNSFGEVTGYSRGNTADFAVVWNSSSGMRELGLRGSIGYGISDTGAVVGSGFDIASGRERAFLWTNAGGMRFLDDLPGGFDRSVALEVNSSGQMAGSVAGTPSVSRAVLWTADGSPIDIGDLPGGADWSAAVAINDHGQVAGYSLSTFGFEAFVWGSDTGMQPLGGLTDQLGYSRPSAINSAGHVVGESETARGRVAFLWSPAGGMVDLGDFPGGQRSSSASDINSSGHIVGSALPSSGRLHAFLWTPDGGMQDLTSFLDTSGAGWNLEYAIGINDAGQIVGQGINPAGMTHAFLLTPIPEPATIALLVFGCLALATMVALARRRRWKSG